MGVPAYRWCMALTREALIELVRRLQVADFDTEAEGDRLLLDLRQAVPDPNVSDLVFWREPPLTAEEVVDQALRYQPITLGRVPGPAAPIGRRAK